MSDTPTTAPSVDTTTAAAAGTTARTLPLGAAGVQLKGFERVLVKILPHLNISYVKFIKGSSSHGPGVEAADSTGFLEDNSPPTETVFDRLPSWARVYGTKAGQLKDHGRAQRKEQQLSNVLKCLEAVCFGHRDNENGAEQQRFTFVDFGGGTGHLGIPLAFLYPQCTVIVVDLHRHSIDLLHTKVNSASSASMDRPAHVPPIRMNDIDDPRWQQCTNIPNLYTFAGPLQQFENVAFDVGIALHLCGEATDVMLRKCGAAQARAAVVVPCCVGKLNSKVKNPYIWQSTGTNIPTVSYPQSTILQQCIGNDTGASNTSASQKKAEWNSLAKAADYSSTPAESRTPRNATRRAAKSILETDRRIYLEETFGYRTALLRILPWEATPKNDILMAWRKDVKVSLAFEPDDACQQDIQRTVDYLICQPIFAMGNNDQDRTIPEQQDTVEWTAQEETEIRQQLRGFVESEEQKYTFPGGMGPRQRKCIHYVAASLGLAHWGVGRRKPERTVVVAKKRTSVGRMNSGNCHAMLKVLSVLLLFGLSYPFAPQRTKPLSQSYLKAGVVRDTRTIVVLQMSASSARSSDAMSQNQFLDHIPFLSVLIPAFNEEERLGKTLQSYREYFETHSYWTSIPSVRCQIVVCNDGSADGTRALAEGWEFHSKFSSVPVQCVNLANNSGKGAALAYGISRILADRPDSWILTADADGSAPIVSLDLLVHCLEKSNVPTSALDKKVVVAGYRTYASTAPSRLLFRWGFRTFVKLTLGDLGVRDSQCGCKLLSPEAAAVLYRELHLRSWAHDVEVFYRARASNAVLLEQPIPWEDQPGSKLLASPGGIFAIAVQMMRDVLVLRSKYTMGQWTSDQ